MEPSLSLFLPENHPIKARLDQIFSKKRLILTEKKLRRNGFRTYRQGEWSDLIVAEHHKIKDYLFKFYTDKANVSFEAWQKWIERISGAEAAKQSILDHGYQSIFKVPKKWIYPLPAEPSHSNSLDRKNFILIVEKLSIQPEYKTKKIWKSESITNELLDALYTVLEEVGFVDNVYTFNLPFTKDGEIAFVDTEKHHQWPVPYHKFTNNLSKSNRTY